MQGAGVWFGEMPVRPPGDGSREAQLGELKEPVCPRRPCAGL